MKKTWEGGLRRSVPDCGNGLHRGGEMITTKGRLYDSNACAPWGGGTISENMGQNGQQYQDFMLYSVCMF